MQIKIDFALHKANLISEEAGRFICHVLFDDSIIECYIPISCKLSKLLAFPEHEVLISQNTTAARRTAYSLFAIKTSVGYIIVNASFANKIVEKYLLIEDACENFRPEHIVEKYKCDFYSESKRTLVEVKSAISAAEELVLPNMISQRAINQLEKLCMLLTKGYRAEYIIVAFAPNIDLVHFDIQSKLGQLLMQFEELGGKITCLKATLPKIDTLDIMRLNYTF